jgi:hypothetical protein
MNFRSRAAKVSGIESEAEWHCAVEDHFLLSKTMDLTLSNIIHLG